MLSMPTKYIIEKVLFGSVTTSALWISSLLNEASIGTLYLTIISHMSIP